MPTNVPPDTLRAADQIRGWLKPYAESIRVDPQLDGSVKLVAKPTITEDAFGVDRYDAFRDTVLGLLLNGYLGLPQGETNRDLASHVRNRSWRFVHVATGVEVRAEVEVRT